MLSYKAKAQDIYNQLGQGNLLNAFDQYYAEDVVMTEPSGTRRGKAECREYEEQFLNNIAEFHNLEVKNLGSDEAAGTTFVESVMDVTFKDGNRAQMEQVAVQQWKGDHITHERFYYNNEQ
jgi:ketosteroid isomerase-like protein